MSAATTTTETTTPDALAVATRELEPAEALALTSDVGAFMQRVQALRARAQGIRVTGLGQEREEKMARETRLALRAERVDAVKRCKALKESTLRRGKAIDGVAAIVRELTEPAEAYLLEQETFTERHEAGRRDALREARGAALKAYGTDPASFADLGLMVEELWAITLEQARFAYEARVDAAKHAEAVRQEAERIAAEKREAARVEAARLEAERVEREKVQAEELARMKAEAAAREAEAAEERKATAARLEAERAAAHAEMAAERAKADAAATEARKVREAAERAHAAETARIAEERRQERAAAEAEKVRLADELAKRTAEVRRADALAKQKAEAEADAAKPTKAKYAVLLVALEKIAAGECEPSDAATVAFEALVKVGLRKAAS